MTKKPTDAVHQLRVLLEKPVEAEELFGPRLIAEAERPHVRYMRAHDVAEPAPQRGSGRMAARAVMAFGLSKARTIGVLVRWPNPRRHSANGLLASARDATNHSRKRLTSHAR